MSLNKAGLELIKKAPDLFLSYRSNDFKGICPASVRMDVETAVGGNIQIDSASYEIGERRGFGMGDNGKAKVLIRTGQCDPHATPA